MLKNIHVIWASLMRAFRIGRHPLRDPDREFIFEHFRANRTCARGRLGWTVGRPPSSSGAFFSRVAASGPAVAHVVVFPRSPVWEPCTEILILGSAC